MSDSAKSNAAAWAASIAEAFAAFQALDNGEAESVKLDGEEFESAEDVRERAEEWPLSVQVRDGWRNPGAGAYPGSAVALRQSARPARPGPHHKGNRRNGPMESALMKHRAKLLRETMKSEPSAAGESDATAYLIARAKRLGMPDIGGGTEFHWRTYPGARNGPRYCIGMTVGETTKRGEFFPGAYSLLMPGYAQHRARVTLETLDDAGEVIASQSLPVETKKGGVIWSREDVRKAAGPVAKPSKRKAAPVAIPTPDAAEPAPTVEMVAQEPQECAEVVEVTHAALGPVEALSEAEAAPVAATELEADPVAALLARVEALEARVDALPADRLAPPTAVAQPKRTAAHERAIRRAWAERTARRRWSEINRERIEGYQAQLATAETCARAAEAREQSVRAELQEAERARDALRADCHEWEELQHRTWGEAMGHKVKRRRAAERARRMIEASRAATRGAQGRADMAQAELARLKASMADPTQPERASDLHRLIQERDAARTALAAVNARNVAMQSAVNDLAERFESMVSRVSRAEAALRSAGLTVAA